MNEKLEEKKKKIDEQIEKNQLRKKLLLEKEKKRRIAKFNQIGKLAFRANIDLLDEQVLLGAFLEIAKQINEENFKRWKENAQTFENAQENSCNPTFSIYFEEEPSKEVKQKMKQLKFIYNRYRREYCGQAQRKELELLLKDCKVKIEELVHI